MPSRNGPAYAAIASRRLPDVSASRKVHRSHVRCDRLSEEVRHAGHQVAEGDVVPQSVQNLGQRVAGAFVAAVRPDERAQAFARDRTLRGGKHRQHRKAIPPRDPGGVVGRIHQREAAEHFQLQGHTGDKALMMGR